MAKLAGAGGAAGGGSGASSNTANDAGAATAGGSAKLAVSSSSVEKHGIRSASAVLVLMVGLGGDGLRARGGGAWLRRRGAALGWVAALLRPSRLGCLVWSALVWYTLMWTSTPNV